MRKHAVILVDGENISYKKAGEINRLAKQQWKIMERHVYHRRQDLSTRLWSEKARQHSYSDVLVKGGPARNRIDGIIMQAARYYLKKPEVDVVCIVSSDSDFCSVSADKEKYREKLCIMGEKKSPGKLRHSCREFIEIG